MAKTDKAKTATVEVPQDRYQALRQRLENQRDEILNMYKQDLRAGQESADDGTEDIVDRANNAYNRELYRQEIIREVELLNKGVDGPVKLFVPDPRFHRAIGDDVGAEVTPEGQPWKGKGSYADYLATVLPTKEDDAVLAEIFKGEWIAAKAA